MYVYHNYEIDRKEIEDSIDTTPIECSLSDLGDIRFEIVSGSPLGPLWDILVRKYHYLGHKNIAGKQLKYLVFAGGQPIAALSFKNSFLRLGARDCFIGWSNEQRKKYLKHMVNNNRFLIPNWIRVPNLASYLLARGIKAVLSDWYEKYGEKIFLVDTFIDPRWFSGSCYKAANWIYIGNTKGYGRLRSGYRYHGLVKEVYVYVVERDFRQIIGCRRRPFLLKWPISQKKEKADKMIIQKADYDPALIDWEGLSPEMIENMAEELVLFHNEFNDAFYRVEQRVLGQYYLQGLMGDIQRKNVEAIALKYIGTSRVRALQKFMTNYKWDDTVMLTRANEILSKLIAEEEGMITLDGSDIPKKGNESVGVARQYCGNRGKVDNCQAGVFVGYTSRKGYGLIDRELYMPEKWFREEFKIRREKCQVPLDLKFKTKNLIALELIKKAFDTKLFPVGWVGFDASFGSDSMFRDEIDALPVKYFGDIRSNTLVWLQRPKVGIPVYSGKGRQSEKEVVLEGEGLPVHVSDIANNPELKWERVILAEGSKGPIIAQLCFMRIVEYRNGLPGKDLWLVMRKDANGKLRYAFSNASLDTPKEEIKKAVTMRWPIEQCFEDGKKYLGMDHYEHRSWPGWHRHMTYVILSLLFLLRLRLKFKKKILH